MDYVKMLLSWILDFILLFVKVLLICFIVFAYFLKVIRLVSSMVELK